MSDLLQELLNTMDGDVLRQFLHQALNNYRVAERSGCFSEEDTERTRTRIILKLTGENLLTYSDEERKSLKNARHFI